MSAPQLSVAKKVGEQKRTREENRLAHRLEQGKNYVRAGTGAVRIPEFLLFSLMIFSSPAPGLGLPFNQVVIIAIVGYAFTKPALYNIEKHHALALLTFLAMGYLAFISITSEHSVDAFDWQRRLLRLVLATMLMWVVASGRIHLRSAVAGYITALVLNVPAYYAGLTPDNYKGYLTGFLNDKNIAGLMYCIFGLLVLALVRRRAEIIMLITVFSVLVWLTGSRTSMAAFAMGVIWILLAPRIPPWGRLALGAGIYFAIQLLTDDYSQSSVFGDRTGTDWFRSRIDEASQQKVENTGFFGRGLGEAYVYIHQDHHKWLFHNSYWSAIVEGGWPWMILVVAITVLCIIKPFSNAATWTREEIYIQGAGIALLICAQRLGEVFYTWPWALCVGYAIRALIISRAKGTLHEHPRDWVGIDGRIKL